MDRDAEYNCEMPFWIDTDAYTDRDRAMFCAGAEFIFIYQGLKLGASMDRSILTENESRIRMMCGKLGLRYEIRSEPDYPEWSRLIVTYPESSSDDSPY